MPRIRSANPDFAQLEAPSVDPGYIHGANQRKGPIPMAFQVTSPLDFAKVLLPHALVLHVNPRNFNPSMTKKIERIQTRGGFVEQHWGDDLTDLSADASTGAFVNIYTGLSSVLRQQTIAWDRFQDLYDLYKHNGSVYNPQGDVVLQGKVMLLFDRGVYLGHFTNFKFTETDSTPFSFNVSWTFKIEHTIQKLAITTAIVAPPGIGG